MLKLIGPNESLEFSVLGYQYPFESGDSWDDSWLNVQVKWTHGGKETILSDPCLTTVELQGLTDWMAAIANGQAVAGEFSFLEPCLRFQFNPVMANSSELKVGFGAEWSSIPERTFALDTARLVDLVRTLDVACGAFPVRS